MVDSSGNSQDLPILTHRSSMHSTSAGSSSSPVPRTSIFASPPVTPYLVSYPVSNPTNAQSSSKSLTPRPNVGLPPRSPVYTNASSAATRARRFDGVEKDADDPTMAERVDRSYLGRSGTPSAINYLFKHQSDEQMSSRSFYSKGLNESSSLSSHLFNRGFLNGLHSDITLHAFGTSYPLHRLLLDRAPFFTSALSPASSWIEASAKDIQLHPEENDPNITQESFELALKSLYGVPIRETDDAQAVNLLATACWLGMAELIVSSVDSLLRQLTPQLTAQLIVFVTSNYYGIPGERLLASAKAMLYKEGWEMPLAYWDDIPGHVLKEVIGGDGFFVPGEWERWGLARRLLERRLRAKGIELGVLDAKQKRRAPSGMVQPSEDALLETVTLSNLPTNESAIESIYNDPNILPLQRLLEEGIYYMHMTFEQLQYIRSQRDPFGRQIVGDSIISDALWMAMELRQRVVNSSESEIELGLRKSVDDTYKGMDTDKISMDERSDIQNADELHEGRKYWIPSEDSTSVIGDSHDSSLSSTLRQDRNSLLSVSNDLNSSSDLGKGRSSMNLDPQKVRSTRSPTNEALTAPSHYSTFPPFRFSADFPSPRALKEKKRLYSKTVWYAGSLWNIYIQKVKNKNVQLGVYLHRAREQDRDDLRGSNNGSAPTARTALLERFSALDKRDPVLTTMYSAYVRERDSRDTRDADGDDDDESGSGGENLTNLPPTISSSSNSRPTLSSLMPGSTPRKASQTPLGLISNQDAHDTANNSDEDWDEFGTKNIGIPTIPPYTDTRPTIKTYFKIYSPSKGGRMLSVYESAPDRFNFSQSWGWKSSTLIIDDGIMGAEDAARGKDGRLRFMVVLGNV